MTESQTTAPEACDQKSSAAVFSELLTVEEAAKFAKISRMALWRLRKSGQLRHFKIGTAVRFSRQQLLDFIAACEVTTEKAVVIA